MIPPLTSIRLFFILIIYLFHCHVPYSQNMGCFGVSFFFILSGFVLSLSYKEKILRSISYKEFYIKRISRIYPIHLLVLSLYVLVSIITNETIVNHINWLFKLILNLLLLQSYIPISTVYFSFSGAWFLSTIILSYLLFPYAIRLVHNYKYKSYLLLMVIPICMLLYSGNQAMYLFYINPIVRFGDFFLGICLADVFRRIDKNISYQQATFLEICALILSITLYCISLKYNIGSFNYSCFYWLQSCILILLLGINKGFISKILSNKIFIMGGKLSFAFFLFHPFLIHFLKLNVSMEPVSYVSLICFIAFASFALSLLSYKYYEPFCNKHIDLYLKR